MVTSAGVEPKANPPPLRILVVEDAPDVAGRVARLLAELDAVEILGPAIDGRQAVQLFGRRHPDVVVMDLLLPDHNGLDLISTFRSLHPPCVIIVLTNLVTVEIQARCRQLGADHFLNKSYDFDRLTDLVRAARDRR